MQFPELPGELENIREVIGLHGAVLVAGAYGGSNLHIPALQALGDDHRLVQLLGRERAERLCREYMVHTPTQGTDAMRGRGDSIMVPLARKVLGKLRVHALGGSGASVDQLARTLGVHRRTVQRYRQAAGDGCDLFAAALAEDARCVNLLAGYAEQCPTVDGMAA